MTVVAWDGSHLYAAGTQDLTRATVWRTTDALTWEAVGSGSAFDLGSCFEGCPSVDALAVGRLGVVVSSVRVVVTGERVTVEPTLWFSPDGTVWEVLGGAVIGQNATTVVRLRDVVAADPGFVATGQVCDPGCRATTWTSSDGRAWSGPDDLPDGREAEPVRIVASEDRMVVIAERCPAVSECTAVTTWSSGDGRTWSEAPLEAAPGYPVRGLLAESRGRFIVLGALGGRITVWAPADGTTWEQRRSEGLPTLGGRDGVLGLHLAGGLLGALLIGEQESPDAEGVTTSAWVSPGS
jgi:hypothetical protein